MQTLKWGPGPRFVSSPRELSSLAGAVAGARRASENTGENEGGLFEGAGNLASLGPVMRWSGDGTATQC